MKNAQKTKNQPIFSIIYELCQNLGYLRSLWKAPETKTIRGALSAPPDKIGLKSSWLHILNVKNVSLLQTVIYHSTY